MASVPSKFDCLKIENQLCFPLYACSKEVVRRYKPFLDELDLTYTQYITMMILWDRRESNVTELGKQLYLDSGTLTPLLEQLGAKGCITRARCPEDERCGIIRLTAEGEALRDKAENVPRCMAEKSPLTQEEAEMLYRTLYKLLHTLHDEG